MIQYIYRTITAARTAYLSRITKKAELRNIEKKRPLWSSVPISDEQDREIRDYWKSISGCDIDTRWHRLYASYLQCPIRKDFFPEILYSTKLEKKLSNPKFYGILSDKGFLTSLFPGDNTYRMPKTVVYDSYGTFTDGDKIIISEEEAIRAISNAGVVIIKPTIDTSSGEGVLKIDFKDGHDAENGLSVKEVFKRYKQNFIVQECVKQSRYLADLCEKSLNTFRVITYICEGKVFHAPLSLRMGNGSSFVDNIHMGGVNIGISDDYKFRKYAFTEYGDKYEVHPYSKIRFEGYDISPLRRIVEVAHRLHGYVPMLKMISWDWSLDENDMPVLIEMNISGQSVWFPQMVNGESFFGVNTKYFANLIKK